MKHDARDTPPSFDMDEDEIGQFFFLLFGKRIPVQVLDSPASTRPRSGQYIIDSIVSYEAWCRTTSGNSPHDVIYRCRFHGYGKRVRSRKRG